MNPKISVCAPCLNEEFFMPIWLEAVSVYADQIVLTDGGSSDGTLDIIGQFMEQHANISVDFQLQLQSGKPYSDDWHENEVRTDLLNRCIHSTIAFIDIDEVVDPNVFSMVRSGDNALYYLQFVPFWEDLKHVRMNTTKDWHWFGVRIPRVVWGKGWHFGELPHHCMINNRFPYLNVTLPNPLYHLHYGFGDAGLKNRDNRNPDLGYDYNEDAINPDWNRDNVKIELYEGPWPEVLHKYLS
jgi:glycosyltransferase involved in cell wall biosynthesis